MKRLFGARRQPAGASDLSVPAGAGEAEESNAATAARCAGEAFLEVFGGQRAVVEFPQLNFRADQVQRNDPLFEQFWKAVYVLLDKRFFAALPAVL